MTKKRYVWGNNYGDLLKDTQNNTLLTMKDCKDLLNKQDKLIKLMESTLRSYDGRWLFDGSILTFAEVLNKIYEEEKED